MNTQGQSLVGDALTGEDGTTGDGWSVVKLWVRWSAVIFGGRWINRVSYNGVETARAFTDSENQGKLAMPRRTCLMAWATVGG
jgi:hypothetical protein